MESRQSDHGSATEPAPVSGQQSVLSPCGWGPPRPTAKRCTSQPDGSRPPSHRHLIPAREVSQAGVIAHFTNEKTKAPRSDTFAKVELEPGALCLPFAPAIAPLPAGPPLQSSGQTRPPPGGCPDCPPAPTGPSTAPFVAPVPSV